MSGYVVCVTETRRAWYRVEAADEQDARDRYLADGQLQDWRGVADAVESVDPAP